jgi:alpha-D-xyloside xylohydrolase
MLRALPFDFRGDPNTYDITDQYMFGPAFLVNPVTRPMYYAANSTPLEGVEKTRRVYLPAAGRDDHAAPLDWYDFWTGARHAGGRTILADAPLDTMPVFVRAGSVIPVGPAIQFTGEQLDAPLELWVYPGQDGEFTLYEDEGDNYNYEQGSFATIHLIWKDRARQLILDQRQGSYPGMPASRVFRVVIAGDTPFDPLATQTPRARTLHYDGQRKVVEF